MLDLKEMFIVLSVDSEAACNDVFDFTLCIHTEAGCTDDETGDSCYLEVLLCSTSDLFYHDDRQDLLSTNAMQQVQQYFRLVQMRRSCSIFFTGPDCGESVAQSQRLISHKVVAYSKQQGYRIASKQKSMPSKSATHNVVV